MATDSTHLLPGNSGGEADLDMAAGGLDLGSVQLAAATDAPIPVNVPRGQQIVVVPVRPGQIIELPTDSPDGLLAKLGADGNLAIVVDGRTIILQGYADANAESPIKIVTNDGDVVDVAEVIVATNPDVALDIQTAAGPAAAGAQGGTGGANAAGSGIFIPFAAGPLLGGFDAEGVLKATQLAYKNIDDERILFPIEEAEADQPDPTPEITIGAESGLDTICVPEDSQGEAVAVHASTDATSHLTTIVISGFPIGGGGFSFDFVGLDLSNTTVVDTILVDGKVTITFDDAVTTDFSGSFIVTPAADSDVDLGTLTAEVIATNNVDPTVKAGSSDDAFVRVDAIADGDDVGDDGDGDKLGVSIAIADGGDLNTSFQASEGGFVHITASFDDFKDGSETHQLTVTAPEGFTFGASGVLPAGVSLVSNDGTTIVLSVDSKDGDGQNGVGNFVLDVPVTYNGGQADGATGDFVATVSTTETPTDEECDTTNNSDTATQATAATVAETPTPDVKIGADAGLDHVCVFEDTTSDPIPVTASTNAGSHLTTMVISGFPIGGAGFTFDFSGLDTDGAGTSVVVDTSQLAALGQVTINFSNGVTGYTASFTVTPPADSDVDLGILTATVTAANDVDPSVTASDNDQAQVVVDAVADGDDVGDDGDGAVLDVSITVDDGIDANSSFQVGEFGTVFVTASFDDFKDGSEVHTLLIVAPPGFVFQTPLVGLPAGVTVIVEGPNAIQLAVDSSDAFPPAGVPTLALPIPVQYVGGLPDGVTPQFLAQVTTAEVPTDLECTVQNNFDTKTALDDTTVAGVPTTEISLNTEGREDVVCVPEDSDGVPIPVTATTTPGSHLTTIVISGFPTDAVSDGWVFDFTGLDNADTSVDFSKISVDGTVTITFDNATTTDFNGSFTVTPPADSDVDLGILTATVEGANNFDPSVTDTDADAAFVRVDAVADGDDVGDDGDGDVFGVTISVSDGGDANATFQDNEGGTVHVTASFDDYKDGSETHTLTVEAPDGFTFDTNDVGTLPTGVTLDASSTSTKLVFIVDSKDGDGDAGVSDLTLDIPVTYGGGEEDGESGDFTATVTTTETPTDLECNDKNNTDSASATDDVTIADAPTTDIRIGAEGNTEAICVPEDSTAVPIPVVASTTAGSHLTTIVISGFPTDAVSDGWVFDFTSLDNADTTVDFSQISVNGTVTITFVNATTTDFNGSFTVSPPDDSDVDLGTLTAEVTAVNNVDATVKDTDADDAFVRVDAVADGDNVGDDGDADVFGVTITVADGADGNASFQNSEVGTVKVTASYDDFTDGSETHALTVDAPDGFTFDTSNVGTIPAGVVLNIGLSSATHLVFDVDSEGADGVADFTLNIPVTYGGGEEDGESGNFTATVTTTEDPTDEECTTGNNTDTATATDDVVIAGTPTTNVSLNTEGDTDFVCVPEDSTSDPIPVSATTSAGSHLTSIVITGFPIGATGFTFNFAGLDTDGGGAGVTVDTSQLNTLGQVTINFTGVQTAYNGSFTVTPAADSDVDLGTLTATVTAANNVDPSVTDTDADQTYVRVDAVADGDDGDGEKLGVTITSIVDGGDANSVFQTGETGTVNVNATFDDYQDGSETHVLTVEAPDNFTFDTGNVGPLPPGVTLDASSTSDKLVFNVDSSNPGGVGSLNLQIPVTYNGGQLGGTSGNFTATVTAQELPTDLECDPDNNFASASDTEVASTNDGPKIDLDPNDPEVDDNTAVVSDEGLTDGLKDDDGVPSDDSDSKTIVGSFTVTDPDGDVLTVKMLDTGTFPDWTFGGTNDVVDWTLSGDGLTLTGEANGSDALTVVIDPVALTYTVTLHQPLNHPDKTVEDELSFPITVEVSDGSLTDTAVLTVEVEDDSPDAKVMNPTVSAIVLDESPVPPNGDGLVSKTVDLSGAFGAVLAFGGDGAGSDSYKFELSSQGIGSGLYELDPTQPDGKGDEILLTSNGDGSIVTGSVNGTTFFTITVDADGKVTFTQENNIWHDDTGDNDDPETLTTDAVDDLKLTQTLTDADGDKDSASVNLGSGVFVIEDDGPKAFDPEDTIVQNKAGATIIGDLDITTHTGSDGLGSIVFGPGTDGQASALKSGGEVIYLFGFGTDTLIGTTDKDNPGDQTDWVFKIELDGATDKYTVTMLDTVDNGSGVVFSDFDNTVAGKDIWVGVDNATNIADPTVEDLLLTAINGTAINTKSTSIGVDNQSVNQAADGKGEGVRIDFVNNVSGTQDVANNWSYDSSIDLNSGSFTIGQLTPTNGDAVVRIRAVDEAFDAKSFNITGNALTGDIQVNLTAANISVKRGLITYSTPAELASIGITVYSMSDGTVVVDGLQVGDETIVTSATTFNRLELVNAANLDVDESASKNIVTGNDWDLSTVSILSFNSGNPVDLSAGVILEDGDGDSVSSTINVQLDPAGASPVINPGTDNPDNINGGTGNDSLDGKAGIDKISGGFGDDAITGGADADTITGGGGNDTINGGAGVDVIDAGDGDDRVVYDASDSSVKGGINADDNLEHAGNLGDVLDISAQVSLDLTAIVNTKYTGFETLEMTGGAGTALKLDASDVIDLGTGTFNPEGALGAAGAKDAIKITGDGTDSVELAGGGWFDVTSQVSDPPVGFKVYAHDSDGDATLTVANINAYVLVENDITTVTGVTP